MYLDFQIDDTAVCRSNAANLRTWPFANQLRTVANADLRQHTTLRQSQIFPEDLQSAQAWHHSAPRSPLSFPAPKTTPSVLVWGSLMQNAGPPSRTSPTKPPRQLKALELSPEPLCVEYESGQCGMEAKTRMPYLPLCCGCPRHRMEHKVDRGMPLWREPNIRRKLR